MRQAIYSLLTSALLLTPLACGDRDASGPDNHVPGAPAAIVIASGDAQAAEAGTALTAPIAVRVTDAKGSAVAGVSVSWSVIAGDGSVSATSNTGTDGIASSPWTLGPRTGTQRVSASVAALTPVTFTAEARAGAAASFSKLGGDEQSAIVARPLDAPLTVKLTDRHGNAIANAVVTWTPANASGTVSQPTSQTNANGEATTSWTIGSVAGTHTLTAHAAGATPVSFTATGRAGAPTAVFKVNSDGQTYRAGSTIEDSMTVRVADAFNNPVPGVTVEWTVSVGGGSVSSNSTITSATGLARVAWTIGPNAGGNQLQARVGTLTSALFHVTGRLPYWTVMVYMAADNNLAAAGIQDIDEMEAAGVDPEVQVVVQAEFNPAELAMYGCGPACFNRPNFNTFRYVLNGQGAPRLGPNGATLDIGNRNMTSAADLRDFITWSKQTAPAQRYALVLWNHGGGYAGLLQDLTSAGNSLMSLKDLPAALTGVGKIDIIDFDMCLMAGHETLLALKGLTDYAVFSEAIVPGAGNPYQQLIDGIQANPAASAQAVAGVFVETFHASYQNDRASTTRSAYDLRAFAGFESALNSLADYLTANLQTYRNIIASASVATQRYDMPELKDIGNFLDSLRVRVNDPALVSRIDEVRSRALGSFRVANRARNGASSNALDVSRSTGLNILLPSGASFDRLPNTGPGSFANYQSLYPNQPWTRFLGALLAAHGSADYIDQGFQRFQAYLIWDTASVSRDADLDFWILEPNGNLYIPYLGSVTPNGTLTGESYGKGLFFEGYLTNQFLQRGRYKFYAHLWRDPWNHKPLMDVAYRTWLGLNFSYLYGSSPLRASLDVSVADDANATWQKVDAGAYTDLQYVAYGDFGMGGQASMKPARTLSPLSVQANEAPLPEAHLTPAQLNLVRQLVQERRERDARPAATPKGLAPVKRPIR